VWVAVLVCLATPVEYVGYKNYNTHVSGVQSLIRSHIAQNPPPSKLDYCNSLIYSINSSQIKRLQTIHNALARSGAKTLKHHHITLVASLAKSPWTYIHYKILSLCFTYNAPQTFQPSYIHQLLTIQPGASNSKSQWCIPPTSDFSLFQNIFQSVKKCFCLSILSTKISNDPFKSFTLNLKIPPVSFRIGKFPPISKKRNFPLLSTSPYFRPIYVFLT